jgi:hypothetical protein
LEAGRDKGYGCRVHGLANCCHLVHYILTASTLFQHANYASDLALSAFNSLQDLIPLLLILEDHSSRTFSHISP